ncbi:MAG TPA: ABC transporter ATP-binding protein [Clostridiaceae bacterium]|nr:ABC transporter ATP-binding protein [Clostridiaceae bacterium]
MSNSVAIEVKNVTKNYKKNIAVDNVSLTINRHEIFGLVGPNGAGKSTLISMLITLIKPDSGDIIVEGNSVLTQAANIRKMIGFVPQDIALYPTLTAYDNLKFWGELYGLKSSQLETRIKEVLKIAGMEGRAHDRIEEYSGGMKRRINIAVALLHHPEILVMDEPTVGVDIISKHYIIDTIKNLKNEGRTIIYTSHDIDEMEAICDRIALMKKGRILMCQPVDKIRKLSSSGKLKEAVLEAILSG